MPNDPFTAKQRTRLWNAQRYQHSVTFTPEESAALWASIVRDSVIRSQQSDIADDLNERMDKIHALSRKG